MFFHLLLNNYIILASHRENSLPLVEESTAQIGWHVVIETACQNSHRNWL